MTKIKQNIISLHGSYFGNNYGDILLVNLFAKWIRNSRPDIVINMPLGSRSTAPDLEYDMTGIMNLFRSKALIFCGGGYFGEKPKRHQRWAIRNFLRHGIIGLIAVLFHIPFAIIGVEFGPISSCWFRRFCLWLARHASVIVVRNEESLAFLSSHGIQNAILSADAVLTLSDEIKPNTEIGGRKKILLHLPQNEDSLLPLIKIIVEKAKDVFPEFDLILINDDSRTHWFDNPSLAPARAYLDKEGVNYAVQPYKTCKELIHTINSSQYIITTKLHVGITSLALGKNTFSVWTHPKTPRLHKMANNEHNCVALSAIDSNIGSRLESFFRSSNYVLNQRLIELAYGNRIELEHFLHTTLHSLEQNPSQWKK